MEPAYDDHYTILKGSCSDPEADFASKAFDKKELQENHFQMAPGKVTIVLQISIQRL